MSFKNPLLLTVVFLLLFSAVSWAQDDKYGKVDTIFAEPYMIDAKSWAINVSLFNDEEILALSIPLTFSDSKNRLVADSTIFTGGVAEAFRVKHTRVDTATQCVTIGLINDVGVSVPPIPPGKGRVATIFISSLDNEPIKSLVIDTITTPPGNNLQLVMPPSEGIVPAFVVKEAGKMKPGEVESKEKPAAEKEVKEEKKPEEKPKAEEKAKDE